MTRYGSAAAPVPDDVKALAGSERYVEYDRTGRVVKGIEVKAKSKYDEDVLINNHTAVWGSWWRDGHWGFKCCHSTVKNSYCTGKVGGWAAGRGRGRRARWLWCSGVGLGLAGRGLCVLACMRAIGGRVV